MPQESGNRPRAAATAAAAAWLVLVAALAAVYAHTFSEMWGRWFPAWHYRGLGLYERIVEGVSYYTHSPLVPLVSLVIVWMLVRHTKIPVRPRRWLGLLMVFASLLVHLGACLARANFPSGVSMIGVLGGLAVLLWGPAALRRLWFPLAFLLFMVPVPEAIIEPLNFRLKMWSADWGVQLANAIGVMAERSGNQVSLLPGKDGVIKTLVIANVCSGLRTLISLLAFGALYAYVCRLRGIWPWLLFAMSVPVAVVSNTLRILSLIVVADVWDVATATGRYHDTSGVLIFPVAFAIMFALEGVILWCIRKATGRGAGEGKLFAGQLRDEHDGDQVARMFRAAGGWPGWAAGCMVILAAGGTWWLSGTVAPAWNGRMARQAVPKDVRIEGCSWHGADREIPEAELVILETRDYLCRLYFGPSTQWVELRVIFSPDNRKGTHPPDQCLEGSGQEITANAEVVVAGVEGRGEVPCRELIVQAGQEKFYFLYTYKCGKQYTGSFTRQQYTILVNGLLARNASGALIRVMTPVGGDLAGARRRAAQFMASAIPCLDKNLP